jgi:hypothetical protein
MQEQIEFRRDDLSGDQALKLIERHLRGMHAASARLCTKKA